MNKLLTRTLTGILFVAIIISAVVYNLPPLYLLFILFSVLCLFELIKLIQLITKENQPLKIGGYIFAVGYSIIPFYLLYQCAYLDETKSIFQFELILGFFIILWANDTGAYLTGTSIGKNPLAPKISPKKTWEGLIGGILTAILSAYILSTYYASLNVLNWLIAAMAISIPAIIGDLFESHLKRKANVKDSGNMLPGHGGFLDRFDALLAAAPFYYLYLRHLVF